MQNAHAPTMKGSIPRLQHSSSILSFILSSIPSLLSSAAALAAAPTYRPRRGARRAVPAPGWQGGDIRGNHYNYNTPYTN